MYSILLYFLLLFSTISSEEKFQSEENVTPGNDLFAQLVHTINTRNTTIDYASRLKVGVTRKKISKLNYTVNFKYHLSKKGAYKLKRLGFLLKQYVDIYADIATVISNATDRYIGKLYSYYKYIDSIKLINNNIDVEYIYLDMIETSNKILFDTALYMLGKIVAVSNVDKTKLDAQMLTAKINRALLEEKKEELKFICEKVRICRQYPAYSDHFANLLDTLFNLPVNKFDEIAKFTEHLIRKNSEIFTKIMRPSIANAIGLKLELLSEDIYELRGVLGFVSKLINNSYKVFKGINDKMLMKAKALRIFLDIIDKAFDYNGEDVMEIEYDTIITLLRQWGGGYKLEIKPLIKDFFDGIIHIIKHVLSPRGAEECTVLMDILYKGETLHSDIFNELFLNGSKFVTGEDHRRNMYSDFSNFADEIL